MPLSILSPLSPSPFRPRGCQSGCQSMHEYSHIMRSHPRVVTSDQPTPPPSLPRRVHPCCTSDKILFLPLSDVQMVHFDRDFLWRNRIFLSNGLDQTNQIAPDVKCSQQSTKSVVLELLSIMISCFQSRSTQSCQVSSRRRLRKGLCFGLTHQG